MVAPGRFRRKASASSAVMKSPEMKSPVPSMKKQRSASPSHAMPMSAFSATTRSTMCARFSSMSGLASWFGKVPSSSMHIGMTWQGSRSNSFGATRPPMPLPASSTHLNGLIERRVDEREHVLDVGGEDVPRRPPPGRRRRRRQRALLDHVADVAQPGVAAERQRLGAHHLDAVVLRRVVRRGDLRAAFEARAGDGEVHHVGRHHPVVDDVGALRARALDEGSASEGEDSRMSRETAICAGAEIGDKRHVRCRGQSLRRSRTGRARGRRRP